MLPPESTTLTALNCDAPVNTRRDITHVCRTVPPADTDPTPKAIANTPAATPIVRLALTTGRISGAMTWASTDRPRGLSGEL